MRIEIFLEQFFFYTVKKYNNITGQKIYDYLLNDTSNKNILWHSVFFSAYLKFTIQPKRETDPSIVLVPRPRIVLKYLWYSICI